MRSPLVETMDVATESSIDGVRTGRLAGRTHDGQPLVDFEGSRNRPTIARIGMDAHRLAAAETETEVVLVFDNGDPRRPIVIGLLERPPLDAGIVASGVVQRDRHETVRIDGKTVALSAKDKLELTCGKSSITLYSDGRVIVKGTRLVSRATESNKIKGATIALN